jgi:hypothetical protein
VTSSTEVSFGDVPLQGGKGIGNDLFMYAAGLLFALSNQYALKAFQVGDHITSIASTSNITTRMAPKPGGPYYQDRTNVAQFFRYRKLICAYFSTSLRVPIAPAPDDVVIYFRTFRYFMKHITDKTRWAAHLANPPLAYFRQALHAAGVRSPDNGAARKRTIWLVGHPCIENDPTVVQLRKEYPQIRTHFGSSAQVDFQFLSLARTMVLSPSTFGWWAGFFSNAFRIYVPIMHSFGSATWCDDLVFPDRHNRFVYVDWRANTTETYAAYDPANPWNISVALKCTQSLWVSRLQA